MFNNPLKKMSNDDKTIDRLAAKRVDKLDKTETGIPSTKTGGAFSKALNAVRQESEEDKPSETKDKTNKPAVSFNAAVSARKEQKVNPFLKITRNRMRATNPPDPENHLDH